MDLHNELYESSETLLAYESEMAEPVKESVEKGTLEDYIRYYLNRIIDIFPTFEKETNDNDDDDLQDGSFISRNMVNPSEMEKCPASIESVHNAQNRLRRSIDPNDYPSIDSNNPLGVIRREYARVKRSAESQLLSLRQQIARCTRDTAGHCEDIQLKYKALVKEINEKLQKFATDIKGENGRTKVVSGDHINKELELELEKKMKRIKDREMEIKMEKEEMARNLSKFIEDQKNKEIELDARIMKMEKEKMELEIVSTDTPQIVLEPTQSSVLSAQSKTLVETNTKSSSDIQSLREKLLVVALKNTHKTPDNSSMVKPWPSETKSSPTQSLLKISINNPDENLVGKTFFGDGFYYTSQYDRPIIPEDELIDNDHHGFFSNQKNIDDGHKWQARIMSSNDQSPVQNPFQNNQQQQQQQSSGLNRFQINQQQQPGDQTHFQPIPIQQQQHQQPQQQQIPQSTPNVTPLKIGDQFTNAGPSGPFLSLCDQITRQNSNNNFQSKSQNVVQPTFASVQDFSGTNRQNIPLTGETSTSSSQIMFNPGVYSLCFSYTCDKCV